MADGDHWTVNLGDVLCLKRLGVLVIVRLHLFIGGVGLLHQLRQIAAGNQVLFHKFLIVCNRHVVAERLMQICLAAFKAIVGRCAVKVLGQRSQIVLLVARERIAIGCGLLANGRDVVEHLHCRVKELLLPRDAVGVLLLVKTLA